MCLATGCSRCLSILGVAWVLTHLAGLQVNGRDAQLYEQASLLTQRTVMAHGVTLTDAELQLLADRGTGIAHCPLSNFYFADVPLDVQRCMKAGVKVHHPPVMHSCCVVVKSASHHRLHPSLHCVGASFGETCVCALIYVRLLQCKHPGHA